MPDLTRCTYARLLRLREQAAPGSPDYRAVEAELAVRDQYERSRTTYA